MSPQTVAAAGFLLKALFWTNTWTDSTMSWWCLVGITYRLEKLQTEDYVAAILGDRPLRKNHKADNEKRKRGREWSWRFSHANDTSTPFKTSSTLLWFLCHSGQLLDPDREAKTEFAVPQRQFVRTANGLRKMGVWVRAHRRKHTPQPTPELLSLFWTMAHPGEQNANWKPGEHLTSSSNTETESSVKTN